MYCVKKLTEDLTWIGGNDRKLAMFEGVYGVPDGVSYNSYFLDDEKTVLLDTVDKAVGGLFLDNLTHMLHGRELDYLVVNHMEPDHTAAMSEIILRYPGVKIVGPAKTVAMIKQFFSFDIDSRAIVVQEGDALAVGRHTLTFVLAPLVHWPEVMMTYDLTDKILFSADAFGSFGALNGYIFADEVDFAHDYLDEMRRYYTNIVGKYGPQVQAVLKKMARLEIAMICPLHGFVWRRDFASIVEKHDQWSSYTPEQRGVLIAYASIYGHTENAAYILACRLAEAGVRVKMYDVSVTHASQIVSEAFRFSHLVLASPTYNAGVFVAMENLLHDLAAHNLQNRTIAFIENGSWAPASAKLMREMLGGLKNITMLEETVSIKSALQEAQLEEIDVLAAALVASLK